MLLRALPAPLALLLIAAGCTAQGDYPSLLPRPAETQNLDEPPPAAPEPPQTDPALDAQIATVLATLTERVSAFDAAATRAARLVSSARGAAAGSDRWLDAQVALAELDSLRSSTGDLAIQLGDMAQERAVTVGSEYPALTAASAQVREAVAAQVARITALQEQLAPA
ncbi:hypothetical protein [Sphingomonas olei]|uniref:DUF4398 domain-containing protein n=1 Tax=Sphingomonas olei TaxID=1886787 RepID=A0ABY2QFF8_9SPHN|nr:hypothetical protein [Sphingomonas olei]THG38701.1 hypothetical protein E5988_14065 [Sphingomonas olei]